MERLPTIKNETECEITFDELASALEEVLITIVDCRRQIVEAENMLKTNQEEYDELVSMLDLDNPSDKIELKKIRTIQNNFVRVIRESIIQTQAIILELESIHGRELKMFEEFKALQREKDFGLLGTVH
jgi:hypothetical protein